ncbi:FkbM family methyltransferase [Halotia wernerae UHCC 0503]|jgi:FkbM family methyltransferase|nr:FkbM family methyltransferase [Halotia wernerae UHCC 0503]
MDHHQAFNAVRDAYLVKLTKTRPEIRYLVIGANDGTKGDPLYKYTGHPKWRGTLFEPLPVPFAALRANYADRPGATMRNVAIVADAPGGKRKFYNVPSSSVLASFRPEIIQRHKLMAEFRHVEKEMVEVEVDCLPIADYAAEPGFVVPDVLMTDTEGYDFTLFQAWWALGWRPSFVEIEVIHITEPERVAIREALHQSGYEAFWYETDVFAFRGDTIEPEDLMLYRAARDQAISVYRLAEMLVQAGVKPKN